MSETEFSSTYQYAYPTLTRTAVPDPSGANGSNTDFTTTSVYDLNTGLPTSVTDAYGQTTTMEYNDALLRPTKTTAPNGQQTITEYGDTVGSLYVKVKSQIDDTNWKQGYKWFDGLGRTIKTQSVETTGDVFAITCYDNMGRVQKSSNPFRNISNPGCSSSLEWTLPTYDALGRVTSLTTPDSAHVDTAYSLATTGSQIGTVVTVTDQASKVRRSVTNALGQLTRVDEPNSSNQLGNVNSPNQATYYSYNTLGKMVRVQQGVQNRYFQYDNLGRLLRFRQPEQEVNTALDSSGNPDNNSWTAGFTYDNNGNVLTTKDAKNTTITNTYDALNRAVTRTYSDGTTPTVTNYYDGTGLPSVPSNSKGKLTKVATSVSESRYTSFDVMGRSLESQQYTDGQTYTSSYVYNLSGALIQATYPSGRVVKNDFDSNGDLSRIYGKPTNTATEQTYATDFSYTPDGKIEKLKLGNNLCESAKLNSRLQVTELALGHSVGDGSLLKLNYDYGELGVDGVSVDATKNAGNIAKQTVNFSGLTNPFVQTYRYDSLDRITEAKETVNGSQTWKQTYGFDQYGNRNAFYQIVGSQQLTMNNLTLPTVDANTNRFAASQGYSYDKNGNVTNDPASSGRTFIFNGDNKQTQVKDANNYTIGTYYYDGEGKRIKKVTDLETTVFVYSSDKLIAEYSTATPPANPTINYTATDQLGSPRVITDKFGQVVSRRDFMPFGEELYADGTNRKTPDKYSTSGQDAVRQRFTGYQKDIETGLDFAEARYYNDQHGRFTAVDPLLVSGKSANPQTFNRYVYVLNCPTRMTDSTGLQTGTGEDEIVARITSLPAWMTQVNNYLRSMAGLEEYEGDQLPSGTRYRERYTSRGPIPGFLRPSEPVGRSVEQFNNTMKDVDGAIQYVPLFSSLYNAQKAGMQADTGQGNGANAVLQTGIFVVDLGTTMFIGGGSRAPLAKNMVEAGMERASGFEAHHIVAFADKGAAEARAILGNAGININDAVNGVFLKGPKIATEVEGIAHRAIHTRAYYDAITNRLRDSQNVRETLTQIGKEIGAGTFPY